MSQLQIHHKLEILNDKLLQHEASLYNSQVEANLYNLRGMQEQAQIEEENCSRFLQTISFIEDEIKLIESEGVEDD